MHVKQESLSSLKSGFVRSLIFFKWDLWNLSFDGPVCVSLPFGKQMFLVQFRFLFGTLVYCLCFALEEEENTELQGQIGCSGLIHEQITFGSHTCDMINTYHCHKGKLQ